MPERPSTRKRRLGILLLVLVPLVFAGLYIYGGFQMPIVQVTAVFRLTNPERDTPKLPAAFEQAKTSEVVKATNVPGQFALEPDPEPGHHRIVATINLVDTTTSEVEANYNALFFSVNQLLRSPADNTPALEIIQKPEAQFYPPAFPARTIGWILSLTLAVAGLWLLLENRPRAPVTEGPYIPPPPPPQRSPDDPPKTPYDY